MSLKGPVLCGASLAVACAALIVLLSRHSGAPRESLTSPREALEHGPLVISKERSRTSSAEWVEALQRKEAVQFVLSTGAPDSGGSSMTVQPLPGPLSKVEKMRLVALFELALGAQQLHLTRFQTEMDPTREDDLLTEAGIAASIARHRAALESVLADEYVLLPAGTPFLDDIPDGIVMSHNIVQHQGEAADAVLYLRFDEHPALHAAVNHRREAERFWSERKCAEFNALPLAERKARVEAHERVTQRILEGPPESLTTAEEQVKWQNDVFRALLPSGVVVDKRTYRATVRMDRE